MAQVGGGDDGCVILWVCFVYLQSVCAEMEDGDDWNPAAVLSALKLMNDIRGPLSWVPLLEPEMQAWEAMIAGAASAAGLQVNHRVRPLKDVVEDAEEKGA